MSFSFTSFDLGKALMLKLKCNDFLNEIYKFLKNKIENNSTWEDAVYQSEWAKINSSWVMSVFFTLCVAANAFKLFCMAYLANTERFFILF